MGVPYHVRLLKLALVRLALAVPMVPWLVMLYFWADAEWTRTATFNGGQPHPTVITVVVIPLLALLVMIIDALVASTLLREYLTEAIGLTRRAGVLFYRWLAASMIAALVVAIVLRLTAASVPAIVGCLIGGPLLFAAILILRASASADEEESHDTTRSETDDEARVARARALGVLDEADTGPLPVVTPDVVLIPPAPLETQATVAVIEQVSDPTVWRTVAAEWAETLRPLQRHGQGGDWGPLARARAEAATLIARGALPFDDMRADQLAVAIDAFRDARDERQLDVACSDLLRLVDRPRALGPGRP